MREYNKTVGKIQREINGQTFDVEWKNRNIFQLPRNRKEKLEMLKTFVRKECDSCWSMQDRRIATLKREFLTEMIKSLE